LWIIVVFNCQLVPSLLLAVLNGLRFYLESFNIVLSAFRNVLNFALLEFSQVMVWCFVGHFHLLHAV